MCGYLYCTLYCRMRHGKIGLQLGAYQKYYISRSEDKQSIQLTITVSKNDAKCMQERSSLINDVTRMLDDIMKVFMPAARKPHLFVSCNLCDVLHITLQQIQDGVIVYCPSSTDDTPLHNYYSDLLSAAGKKVYGIVCNVDIYYSLNFNLLAVPSPQPSQQSHVFLQADPLNSNLLAKSMLVLLYLYIP